MKTELLLDYRTILANQARPVHFALRFTADPVAEQDRRPLAFCVVLDRSGSMAGPPLSHARLATRTAIRNLRPDDRFSLVIFDDTAQVLIPLQTATNRNRWHEIVDGIDPGGSTNLTGGWMLGADELAKTPPAIARRLLVLSDGQLNHGIVDPDQVRGIVAAGLESRGIRTTCLGFGDHYDEELLGNLARATNGGFYDADSAEKLPGIFAHELDGLQAVSVQNLRIRLKPLDFCERIAGLNEYPCVELPDGRREFAVGDLVSGEERVAVFALQVLPLPAINGTPVASLEGETLLEVELAYDELTGAGIVSRTIHQLVRVQATQDPADVTVNGTVLAWVAVQRAGQAIQDATRLSRAEQGPAALRLLDQELERLLADPQRAFSGAAVDLLMEARRQLQREDIDEPRLSKTLYAMKRRAARASSRDRQVRGQDDFRGEPQT